MARPKKLKIMRHILKAIHFKPLGKSSGKVTLELEELEAIRLADYNGFYQEKAAKWMGVSRQTFGRLLSRARHKIADALVNGKDIVVEPGSLENYKIMECKICGRLWRVPKNYEGPCPSCSSQMFTVDAKSLELNERTNDS